MKRLLMTWAEDGSSLICAQILFCTEPASSSKSPGSIKAFVIVLSNVCPPNNGNLLTGKRGYKLGLDTILAKFHIKSEHGWCWLADPL